jgi:hypothetical protein
MPQSTQQNTVVLMTEHDIDHGLSGERRKAIDVWVKVHYPQGPINTVNLMRRATFCGTWIGVGVIDQLLWDPDEEDPY